MAGSIEWRDKGTARLIVSKVKPDGTRKKYYRTIKTSSPKVAEKELAKFVTEVEGNNFIEPSKLTFSAFVDRWLKEYAEKDLAPKTVHRYKQILNTRILPALGHIKIQQLKPIHLKEFYNNLTEDGIRTDGRPGGLSGKTILQHHRILSSILTDAVQWEVIDSNPASRVKPPKAERKEAKYYDEEQVADLLEAVSQESIKHQVLVHLAIFSGLRRGELMGLEWKDVNFDKGTIEVIRTGQYIPGQGTFTKTPKNETSKRVISLPSSMMTLLKYYKATQNQQRLTVGDLWQGSERIFTTWDGRNGHPEWPSQWFSKFIKKHKLPPLNFHGLRHTSITLLIAEGVPLANISKRAGHANVTTTGNIYAHALKSADRDAADKLENLYNSKLRKQA
ncbi:MAG: putative prophage phiRv2 integrase [Pelotomaculum sp. PtaB.Bin104]|nr:MAG: putative prophage phiRv2 integrase [Pelotomaculum sp. PtaB.Bin104]